MHKIKFGSVCSGIEAASVAWNPLGWEASWFSEINPFSSAVLQHHYPTVPNLGDMSILPERIASGEVSAPEVFCGGTPCQAFSNVGSRNSLSDERGNLSLIFCRIANAIDSVRIFRGQQPSIIFWENVPGVLTTKDNAFGCFLAELAGEDEALIPPGGKWTNAGCVSGPQRTIAWRVLDAKHFGVAQQRKRVFVVASAREGFRPDEILFEFKNSQNNLKPSRKTQGEIERDIKEYLGTDRKQLNDFAVGVSLYGLALTGEKVPTLTTQYALGSSSPSIAVPSSGVNKNILRIRNLTPIERERLQGFPDDYTKIPWRNFSADECPPRPRAFALGNSWAVPVVRWLGQRVNAYLQESRVI